MDSDALITAIRDVLLSGHGSVRTVAPGTFIDAPPASLRSDLSRRRKAGVKPCVDVEMGLPVHTGAVMPVTCDVGVYRQSVRVTIAYPITPSADAEDVVHRRTVRAQASTDARAVWGALTWPGNLNSDASARTTGLVGGALVPVGTVRVMREDWSSGVYEVEMSFDALSQAAQATS